MLRTVASSNVLRETLRKSVRTNAIRSASIECSKRSHFNTKPRILNQPNLQKWHVQILRLYSSDLPPHTKVPLPALSPTMETGTIVSWEKKEGDKLSEGDLLAEIETDKATMGFETPEEGYLAKILIPSGTKNVPIGKIVCIIVENEGDIAKFKDFKDDGAAAPAPAAAAPAPAAAAPAPAAPAPPAAAPSAAAPPPPAGGRVYASPMAKRLAEQKQIRLQGKGTGLFGSITSKDLDKLAATPAPPGAAAPPPPSPSAPKAAAPPTVPSGAAYVDIPVSNIRAVIAKRLMEAKQQIPHYYLSVDINMDKVMKLRSKINKKLEKKGVKLTLNDFVIKATAAAAKQVPDANTAWLGDSIRQYKNVDVSVAVSTPKGLLTPIIFEANDKGVVQISKEMKELAAKAKDGKLQPHEFQGGTISVSNLGMFGISQFCAIINPPQSIIVAVGTTETRLIPDDSEKGFKVSTFLKATASCDHRTVDGAVGAEWLSAFRDCLEDPQNMIL